MNNNKDYTIMQEEVLQSIRELKERFNSLKKENKELKKIVDTNINCKLYRPDTYKKPIINDNLPHYFNKEDYCNDLLLKIIPDGIHYEYAYIQDSNQDMMDIVIDYIKENSEEFIKYADDKIKKIAESKKNKLFEYNEQGYKNDLCPFK